LAIKKEAALRDAVGPRNLKEAARRDAVGPRNLVVNLQKHGTNSAPSQDRNLTYGPGEETLPMARAKKAWRTK